MMKTKFTPYDFIVVVSPHLTKEKNWNGEVSLKMVVDNGNPLNDNDFEAMINFVRQICASVPLMEENKVFRDATEELADRCLPVQDMFDIPNSDKALTLETEDGNVIHIDFNNKTKH